jgi:hypothetical protein
MVELTKEFADQIRQLLRIFMPRTMQELDRLYPGGGEGTARFAHYTSADAALKIIRSKRLWMRDAGCMTDYREIEHGYQMQLDLLNADKRREAFKAALDAAMPGVAQAGLDMFDQNWPSIRRGTFIAALSEHLAGEDTFGRLSMWRASGAAGVRVALIARLPAFSAVGARIQVVFTPVSYATQQEAFEDFDTVISRIRENADYLKGLDPNVVRATVFVKFLSGVVSMKHEIFREEREWRAVYTTVLGTAATLKIDHTVESFGGVPQKVYHMPLDKTVHPDLSALDFAEIFDGLIIGPTQYPLSLKDAFTEALEKAGVKDAASKIRISGIPLRT